MESSILPLHQTACSTVCEALLDHSDPHSEGNRRTGRHLVEQLKSNVFAPISGDVLKMFVKRYPSCLTSDLLLLLAPPHLRVLDLTKCHNIGKSESDLQALRQAFSRCKHLQSLVLNEIRSEAHNTEALIEAIVDTAPQLTSVSMEHIPVIEDKHVQVQDYHLLFCAGMAELVGEGGCYWVAPGLFSLIMFILLSFCAYLAPPPTFGSAPNT
nr:uncharacterized protein LOC129255613 [Lytechinus pictus]